MIRKNLICVSRPAPARIGFPSLVLLHVVNFPIIERVDFPVVTPTNIASVITSGVLEVAVPEKPQSLRFHILNVIDYVEKHSL